MQKKRSKLDILFQILFHYDRFGSKIYEILFPLKINKICLGKSKYVSNLKCSLRAYRLTKHIVWGRMVRGLISLGNFIRESINREFEIHNYLIPAERVSVKRSNLILIFSSFDVRIKLVLLGQVSKATCSQWKLFSGCPLQSL